MPAFSYDVPLTDSAIRDAYFLGKRQASRGTEFLAEYTRTFPELGVDSYKSTVTLETPFAQVAIFSSKQMNYSAQDAVKDFSGKPLPFRIHMDILYENDAPPNGVTFKLVQNDKELTPESVERAPYLPATDKYARSYPIGETFHIELQSDRIASSTLTILIDTSDEQHAEFNIDLRSLR